MCPAADFYCFTIALVALLALVFLHLHPSVTPGNPTTAPHSRPASATFVSTTIASSTSSATPSATPYFLVAAKGVSSDQFKAFTEQLSENVESRVISNRFGIARVVELTSSQLNRARNSQIVFSATLNARARVPSSTFNQNKTSNDLPATKLDKRADPMRGMAVPGSYSKGTLLDGHSWNAPNVLYHLQSLSRAWFSQGIDNQHQYNYEADPGEDAFIYIAEAVDLNHPEFTHVAQERVTINSPTSDPAKLDRVHGTKVASVAGGYTIGVASSATLISIEISDEEIDIFEGLHAAYQDIVNKKRTGVSVVNMSWGLEATTGSGRCGSGYWLALAIQEFLNAGVPVVVSGGNNGEDPVDPLFSNHAPRCYNAFMDDLIVVGAVDKTGKRAAFSAKCDAGNTTPNCMTTYAVGENAPVADPVSGGYVYASGTSYSTPIISGLTAYLLTHPSTAIRDRIFGSGIDQVARGVRDIITDWSWSRMETGGVDWPNVAWNGVVE